MDLNKIEALAKAATPGPWHVQEVYAENGAFSHLSMTAADGTELLGDDLGPGRADTNFIAAANPAAVLEMIALIRKQEAALAGAQARIGGLLLVQAGLVEALQKIIDMNVQYAIDKYDDASKAESMACVSTARAALARVSA